MKKLVILLWSSLFLPVTASAIFELGVSGNYRKVNFAEDTYDESLSYTGSISYYLTMMSAIELSYTSGKSVRHVPGPDAAAETTFSYGLLGFDFIYTFAERTAAFIPYVKVGVAHYMDKKMEVDYIDNDTGTVTEADPEKQPDDTTVPSAGVGVKIRLTETMSLKLGMEAWASQSINEKPIRWDMAGRAGLSWFL